MARVVEVRLKTYPRIFRLARHTATIADDFRVPSVTFVPDRRWKGLSM
jgi:hypothetical protein